MQWPHFRFDLIPKGIAIQLEQMRAMKDHPKTDPQHPHISCLLLQSSYSGLQDLLQPSSAAEKKKHKLRRLVQSPNSFFMDVRCPGCYQMWVAIHSTTLRHTRYSRVWFDCPIVCIAYLCPLFSKIHSPRLRMLLIPPHTTVCILFPAQHNRVQPRPDHRHLPGVQLPSVPADWRKGPVDRWLLFPAENQLNGYR